MNEQTVSVERMHRDIASAAATLSDDEARFLVDAYYTMQDDRKRADNQVRALGESQEPNSVLAWLAEQSGTLEKQITRALDKYTEAHPMGSWMREVYGIGPVISAGLLAHLSIEPWRCKRPVSKTTKACLPGSPCTPECGLEQIHTVGHWWRYAGLDPTVKWERSQKRPWNATLKTLCWKLGQSFMKFSNAEECFYGHIYRQRKEYENTRNDSGQNKELAATLALKVAKSTEAFKHLSAGKLPPGQIDARARRYAVKLFLSHLHGEWYRKHFHQEPPKPYPISILGHAHEIKSPH